MAVTFGTLTQGGASGSLASAQTASISSSGSFLVMITCGIKVATGTAPYPTISGISFPGGSGTVLVNQFQWGFTSQYTLTHWVAYSIGSMSGQLTFSVSPNVSNIDWIVDYAQGFIKPGAVPQYANEYQVAASTLTANVTTEGLKGADSRIYACLWDNFGNSFTAATNYTMLQKDSTHGMGSLYSTVPNVTAPEFTNIGGYDAAMIAIEVAAAPVMGGFLFNML